MCEIVRDEEVPTEVNTTIGLVGVVIHSQVPAYGGILNITGYPGCAIEAGALDAIQFQEKSAGETIVCKLPCKRCKSLVRYSLTVK